MTLKLLERTVVRISEHLFCFEDTCNVYALIDEDRAVLIDFGSGAVLDWLASRGISQVSDVLMTHHHRDQGQGLQRAVDCGARIWAPQTEQDLFAHASDHWQAREVSNNYNMRQDRFSLLESVPLAGTLGDYDQLVFGGNAFAILPTPGHTPGSISLITVVDGQRVGFTGDLIAAPGKLWSLAATQWTYNGAEGAASSLASLLDMQMRGLEVLLPSHGEPIGDPPGAIMLLTNRLEDLLRAREEYAWVRTDAVNSYRALSPHLLHNQHSNACSYVLLSQSGKALLIDFGYDFSTGLAAGSDRAARRPWLYSLDGLKRTYGVECIDVVLPTHYHDDHVAGFNLLRRVEGTQVWAAKTVADVLVDPARFNLPCLWYDPIPVDAVLPTGTPFQWEEYWLELHPLPGHTRHAVAISFVVDGRACLATGDQYQFGGPPLLNYVYQNDFAIGDYRASAALLRRLRPDVLLTGHWGEQPCPDEFIEELSRRGNELESLHLDLLAEDVQGLGAGGLPARIQPYRSRMRSGETAVFEIELINPFPFPSKVEIRPVFPTGWTGASQPICLWLGMGSGQRVTFNATAPATTCRRARLAIDLRIGEHHYGQAAEALVDVV